MSDAVFYACLVAVRDTIRGLDLADVPDAQIVWQKHPLNMESLTSGVFVTPVPETITPATNRKDDVGYGVQVTMVQASNQDLTANTDRFLLWREKIRKAFQERPLAGVASVYRCKIEPASVFWALGFQQQHDIGALVVRCYSRE